MCDTIVALGSATKDGAVIFGKNSDREPNEAHQLLLIPAGLHPEGSKVQCTYMEIPQVPATYAVLLAKPFWIWGAEMGANSEGVVIGNEAVFTRVPYEKGPGLIGMDFIRLALERASTARAALELIVNLLETYDQGGNCGFTHPFYYHNSFILADPQEAWVLETAGRQWAAERVEDVRSISNAITIGREWDLASVGLVDFAIDRGWCKNRDEFDFSRCYSDFLYTRFSDARSRCSRSTALLRTEKGKITVETMMSYLRDHGPDRKPDWTPGTGLAGSELCMHLGFGPVRINQTVGSMVSHLTPEVHTHWLTGTSAPCTAIFKPVWLDSGLPDGFGFDPQGTYDEAALWWRHETLHRSVLRDYSTRLSLYRQERDDLESKFIGECEQAQHGSPAERAAFSACCFSEADQASQDWTERVRDEPYQNKVPYLYMQAWKGFNRAAKISV